MICVDYNSVAHKQRAYVERTLPGIFRAALAAKPYRPFVAVMPGELHEKVRAGRYLPELGPRDCIAPINQIIEHGGDCEDWTAVQIWHANSNGHPVRVVTAGSETDNFEHVYVEMWDGDRWVASNPKGNQIGMDYGQHSDWPVKRRWEWRSGRLYEVGNAAVRGSGGCGCAKGSGAEPDPMIRSESDADKWLTPQQLKKYLDFIKADKGFQAWQATVYAIQGGYHNKTRDQILTMIGERIDKKASQISASTGAAVAGSQAFGELLKVKGLDQVNKAMAAEFVAKWLENDAASVRQFAIDMDGNPNADDRKLGGVVVAYLTLQSTNAGVVFDDWIAAYEAKKLQLSRSTSGGEVDPVALLKSVTGWEQVRTVTGSAGIFDVLESIGDFIRDVFVTAPGKFLQDVADLILSADEKNPLLAQFFLRPLGFSLQARVLKELGDAMAEGRARAFDTEEIAREAGATMSAAGQALLVASPFLPPPYNVLAAAAGALSIAAGGLITAAATPGSSLNTGKMGEDVTIVRDQYGRQIGADGLPVDPMQRQKELQRRQAYGVDPRDQGVNDWRRGSDGLVYGWIEQRDQQGVLLRYWWTTVSLDQAGNVLAAWLWNDTVNPAVWRQIA